MDSSEGGEEGTSQDDIYIRLERYLQLINLLQETIPHVAMNFIPPELQNPERFYQHVADYFKDLNLDDRSNLKKIKKKLKRSGGNEEQLFSRIGVPTMHKILTKIKKFKDNLPKNAVKKLYMWKLLENEVVRDGWDIAESPEDFNEWVVRIKDVLVGLGVSEQVIENKLNIIIINKEEHELLQKQMQSLQHLNQQMKENERKISASAGIILERKNQIHIEKFVGKNKGHKSMAELLEPVVHKGKDHDDYGKHFSKIDDAYYIVQHSNFSLGGETSNVFLGYFRQLNAHPWVAIKTSSLVEDKSNEFQILKENLGQNSSEPHKNVISFYAHATFGSQFFLIMPLCDYTLDEYLNANVSYVERCNLAKQFLKGMAFLHDKDIIHRDLKPNNVLIKFDVKMRAVLKISDFNVSCRVITNGSNNEEYPGYWLWDAPEKEDLKEDDVFTSCLLLCYIFFGEHPFKHPTRRDLHNFYIEMKSDVNKKGHEEMMAIEGNRPLSKWYKSRDCHDDVLKYLDKILVHFLEHKLQRDIERNQEFSSENQSVVTKGMTYRKEQLKNELEMSKICNDFKYQIYSIKHPRRTNGKRYAMFVSYSYQKLFSDAVAILLDQDTDHGFFQSAKDKGVEEVKDSSGKRKDDMKFDVKLMSHIKNVEKDQFAGIEDVTVLRKVFKNCQFSIIPKVIKSRPKVSDVVDITDKKFMDNIRAVYKEVGSEYEGDVFLFIWISGHGYHDVSTGDTWIKCGFEVDGKSFYIKNRIEEINDIFKENSKVHLKILMAVSCCRFHQNGPPTDISTTPEAQYSTDTDVTLGFIPEDELPNTNFTPTPTAKNVYGIYSTSLGYITPSNQPNSTYPSIFGDALANEIMPNRSIKEAFERVIDRKPTYYMREGKNRQLQEHTLQPELFPYIDEEIGQFVF